MNTVKPESIALFCLTPGGVRLAKRLAAMLPLTCYTSEALQEEGFIPFNGGFASAAPLAERIRDGQRSVFFGYQADYALATTTEPPAQALGAFETATHALLDTRLMMAWARALDGSGHPDEARTLAQRRSDSMGALAVRATRLPCRCGKDTCPVAGEPDPIAARFVVHLLAEADTIDAVRALYAQ